MIYDYDYDYDLSIDYDLLASGLCCLVSVERGILYIY